MAIVFTNGCFDLLHGGHRYFLREASKLGRVLIVGLNSDVSVAKLKGPTRPIQNENERRQALSDLPYVDDIILFDEPTPLNLIKKIKPDILVKGGDYKHKEVIGSGLVKDVRIIPFQEELQHISTTRIIMNIKRPQIHKKFWGLEKWIENNDLYCGKILILKRGYRCSYHYHKKKDETFCVLSGLVLIKVNDNKAVLNPGDSIRVHPNDFHSFFGLEDSQILEISTSHFDADSYRKDFSQKVF